MTVSQGMQQMYIDQAVRFLIMRPHFPPAPSCVLEVGCGAGTMAGTLAQEGYKVTACDRGAEVPASIAGTDATYFPHRGTRLPLPDSTYDCVFSCDVLEHVESGERELFISELFRVVKPGGRVVITAYVLHTFGAKLWGATELVATGTLPQWYVEHISLPTPTIDETTAALARHGAVIHTEGYQALLGMLAMSVQRLAAPWRAIPLGMRIAPLLRRLDVVGHKTSRLFVVEKHREQAAGR